jgi:catechol 2,3-dioxygenase-like lactoylglutathione lyase family enzyme
MLKRGGDLSYQKKSYLEHVAYFVRDIQWHIRFFKDALGMDIVNIDGDIKDPSQVWLEGGLQLISAPDFTEPAGGMGHIAIVTEDLEQALKEVYSWNVTKQAKGENWVGLPDGLVLELIQASGNSIKKLQKIEVSYR